MKMSPLSKCITLGIGMSAVFPQSALAYVGPGAGLSAIGAFLAIVAGIIVAIFGFIWYPVKRLLRNRKKPRSQETSSIKK